MNRYSTCNEGSMFFGGIVLSLTEFGWLRRFNFIKRKRREENKKGSFPKPFSGVSENNMNMGPNKISRFVSVVPTGLLVPVHHTGSTYKYYILL